MTLILRLLLSLLLFTAGTLHFWRPALFVKIVPDYLPYPLALVYLSGAVEFVCAIGLLYPPTVRYAAWLSVLLFIGVFPANLYMATHHIRFSGLPDSPWVYWGRLPLQLVLIVWAWWLTRD